MKVSIIIPNYNGAELLKKNLPKVMTASGNAEIIVVDDCSTDNSIEILEDFPVSVIRNEKNLGFSPTVNKGVKEASGEIVVLLNTDVSPEKDFLIPLLDHFKDEKVFAVGCMDKSIEGSKTVLRGRGLGKWERGFLVHRRGDVDKTNTLWVNGGSGAFRKSIWEKLGGFNELYSPFYWEDIDISYRALKSGYGIFFEQKSIVIHEHEKGAIKNKYSQFNIKTIAYRNQFIFVWLNITDFSLVLSHIFWLSYHFINAIRRKDSAFFLGFMKALLLFVKILESRRKIKGLFKRKDKEIFILS
ncbi:MAG: glycosyltransferase family 2 protein [Candidatus Levyibacteriota bacterium]|nr:MAG: glycosyltransferase family 2 protein [Candidatus Levybacteria bacterium]